MIKVLKKSVESTLVPDSHYDPDWTYIEIPSNTLTYNFTTYVSHLTDKTFIVDWGDGTINHCDRHTYITNTDKPYYTIKVKGIHRMFYHDYPVYKDKMTTSVFDRKYTTGLLSVERFPDNFRGDLRNLNFLCTNLNKLTKISPDAFQYCKDAVQFVSTFHGCEKLIDVPSDLFKGCTEVKSFLGTFVETGLKQIPENLFSDCINVTNFNTAFCQCQDLESIPGKLFSNCLKVKSFCFTFSSCSKLTSIPSELFKNNVEAVAFIYTFNCDTNLTNIPLDLFKKNRNAIYLHQVFDNLIVNTVDLDTLLSDLPGKNTFNKFFGDRILQEINSF